MQVIIEVPDFISEFDDKVEAEWIRRQVQETLETIKDEEGIEFTEEQVILMVGYLYDNHEGIDQDADWRVRDFINNTLGVKVANG